MKLLICICYHHSSDETLKNLFFNLRNIKSTYKCQYKIVIHVNTNLAKELILSNFSEAEIHVCSTLLHPFDLTWQHRQYIKDHINDYDVFMYIEDDMLIKYEQLTNYLKNLEVVWPNYVPTFFRYELNKQGERYAVDVTRVVATSQDIISFNNKKFCKTDTIYCACWVLPGSLLKELLSVCSNCFTQIRPGLVREHAASFVNWHLKKPCLIELEKDKFEISDLCTIHHLSNKYVNWTEQKLFGKTKLTDVLYKG